MNDGQPRNDNHKSILRNENSISVFPLTAGLPLATGLKTIQQTKHWKAGVAIITKLLELLAIDNTAGETFKSNGLSLADLAKREMPIVQDTWARFFMYFWPYADEQRTVLLASALFFMYIGDDCWEMHGGADLVKMQKNFIPRITRSKDQLNSSNESKSALQSLIDFTIKGFHDQDSISGNGGQEVIDHILGFFSRPEPPKEFKDFDEFINYRIEDAAMPYVFASVKFSLGSSIDIASPKLEKLIRLASIHVPVVNDLASWKKEKHHFDTGKIMHLINTVDMIRRVMCLSDEEAAIGQTYALQLQIECQIDAEVERLMVTGALDEEEWRFVNGILTVLSGNVLSCSVMSRYGGEATRL